MAGQVFSVDSLGGFYAAFNLSKEIRQAVRGTARFRQFADIKDAWSKVKRSGQTFTWDTVPMMSRASRALAETNTIPSGNHTILQGTLTVNERGFSVPFTEALETLSMLEVREPIMRVLRYDALCDTESLVHQQFNKTPLRAAATATADGVTLTTNSTATLTVSQQISTANVKSIVDKMKDRNIPKYKNGDYYAIARHGGLRNLKNMLEQIHQYTDTGLEMIMNGEIGRYAETRFIEQTVIPAGGAADSSTFDPFTDTGDAWNAAAAPDWAFFFGEDTVCEAVAEPIQIRVKRPDDYGRSQGVAWYALHGFGIAHTNTTQARIVKWDSAV